MHNFAKRKPREQNGRQIGIIKAVAHALFHQSLPTQQSSVDQGLLIVCSIPTVGSAVGGGLPLDTGGSAGNVLPRSAEPATSAGQQTLLFLLSEVIIELLLVKLGSSEEHDDKDNHKDTQEGELGPEVKDAKEGEVDADAVEEGGHDRGCADQPSNWVVGVFPAGADGLVVLATVWLFVAVAEGTIAEGLRAESGVLWCHHHSNGVVESECHQGEEDSGHEHCLW